jgi:hypothetical protein
VHVILKTKLSNLTRRMIWEGWRTLENFGNPVEIFLFLNDLTMLEDFANFWDLRQEIINKNYTKFQGKKESYISIILKYKMTI